MALPADAGTRVDQVAVVKQLYASFAAGDLESVLRVLATNVEWTEPINPWNPCGGTRVGHQGFLEWASLGQASEDILELTPMRFLTGDNMVGVLGHTRCRARSTGKSYETDFVHVVTFESDKVRRFQEFFDTHAAGEAFRPQG